jgi:small subunit ribosomal protein S1
MSEETLPTPPVDETPEESTESFSDLFAEFERTHSRSSADDSKQLQGTVVSLDAESVYLDIGFKTEGILPRSAFPDNAEAIAPGAAFPVSVKGRNVERYYELSRIHIAQPKDWSALEAAFAAKTPVSGFVTAVVKGGLSVDVGVRAFMPASRSGVRDAAEMEKLVGQQITCLVLKLDVEDEDVVVDRRSIAEAQAKAEGERRYAELHEGDIVEGNVRSLTSFGAFIDLGGIDGLLHVSDISWTRINAAEDVLSVDQPLRLKVLKIDPETKRLSLGLKQLEAEPWTKVEGKYQVGERVTGTVTRLLDFGAFVELEPGIEGLIHVSEMSWVKKVRKPSDLLKTGETVEALILSVDPDARRISLGLKQTLGDPWQDVAQRFPAGSAIQGPVTRLMKFGAFVQLAEGVEGLVHVSEIVADKHVHHPQDVLRVGEIVKAQVLALDPEKRQIKLSIKQLIPTGLDEFLAEHNPGDAVSGRVVELSSASAVVELGEGVRATCPIAPTSTEPAAAGSTAPLDLSSLSSMLNARWKGESKAAAGQPEPLAAGQVRSFKISQLDRDAKIIQLQLA